MTYMQMRQAAARVYLASRVNTFEHKVILKRSVPQIEHLLKAFPAPEPFIRDAQDATRVSVQRPIIKY